LGLPLETVIEGKIEGKKGWDKEEEGVSSYCMT
jgi:hypothetical protein